MQTLSIETLTRAAFAPFGDVIEADAAALAYPINDGTAMRYHALARVDCQAGDGHALISLVRAQPRAFPFLVTGLERHPLGSQAFIPLNATPYLIVVATTPQATPRAFLAAHGQGINFHRGTWHHPLLALDGVSDFLVVDRAGAGDNCEEATLPQPWRIERGAPAG